LERVRDDVLTVLRRFHKFNIDLVFPVNLQAMPSSVADVVNQKLPEKIDWQYATCIAHVDSADGPLAARSVLLRAFDLRLGKGDYKTQGKSANQVQFPFFLKKKQEKKKL
jgi:hypothetical protein